MTVMEVPLGERIGSVIFWGLLVVLLSLLAWAMIKRSQLNRGPKAGASGKDWTKPEDYQEHHRVVWEGNPATFTPTSTHWLLGVCAVLGICTGDPWDRLAFKNLNQARSGLQEAWGIRSRPQLLARVYWLLREGHRVEFAQEVQEWMTGGLATVSSISQRHMKNASEQDRERAQRSQWVRENVNGICDVNFEAWDLVRAAMLCRAGYSLDWLSAAETLDTLNLLAACLQRHYSSWDELGEQFNKARWYWGSESGIEARQEQAHDISRQDALLDSQRGPWAYIPWTLPLPESELLLVDALVAEEIVAHLPDSSPTPLASVIDDRTAKCLAARS